MNNNYCIGCGKASLEKDIIALNRKLLGKSVDRFYCMNCLANYLEVTVDELNEKIEEFKEEGCTLFL